MGMCPVKYHNTRPACFDTSCEWNCAYLDISGEWNYNSKDMWRPREYTCYSESYNDELNQTIVIWRLFVVLLSISSHFSTRGSQVRCKLANYVSKFKNWARTSQQSSQVYFNVSTIVNKCSQFKLKLTIQLKVLGPVGYQEVLYFIELVIIIYMNIYLQTKFANFVAKFAPNFRTWKRNWQVRNELGNRCAFTFLILI
jgi:hypothetical protein